MMSISKELESKILESQAGSQWQKIGVRHHHGICLPLFSLHSELSCGIGEFLDLIPLVFWCKEIGLDVIQLLPLNDTGHENSPYSAVSALALNPLHLSIKKLPLIEQVPGIEDKIANLQKLNQTNRVEYDSVRKLKEDLLDEWYRISYLKLSENEKFQKFVSDNFWLTPYALYKSIKESRNWESWENWPSSLKSPSEQHYRDLVKEHTSKINFHKFLQFYCFEQLESVKEIAQREGILIKGDIPILIGRDSADVWSYRTYFFLHVSAGAPPDLYNREGQDWGFPIYDWESLEKRHYNWWKERLRIAAHLYDLYRLDHIVGFFRIWAIPCGKSGKEGNFIPEEENSWIPHGKKIMEMMLHSAPLLPIGEDLGTVPNEVRTCLRELGICGTKLMRWERRWETDCGFIPISEYPPESMTTVSSHDSDTLQLWWRHSPKEAKLYAEFKNWDYKPFLSLDKQKEILWDSHHSASLFHINLLQEYLALYPELVSSNESDERINIPGKKLDTNWTYRFKPSLEEMIAHSDFKKTMKEIIT